MVDYDETEVCKKHGYACKDDPDSRVASAVRLYTRKSYGVKYHVEQERDDILAAILKLPSEHRAKVHPKSDKRPNGRSQAAE